jgi:hypothetical protein
VAAVAAVTSSKFRILGVFCDRSELATSQERFQEALVALQASGRALGGSGAALGGSGGALGGPGRGLGGSIYTKTPDQPHQRPLCYHIYMYI